MGVDDRDDKSELRGLSFFVVFSNNIGFPEHIRDFDEKPLSRIAGFCR